MPFDTRKVINSLKKKGFKRGRNTDHEYYIFWSIDGIKPGAKIHFSHGGNEELSDDLLSRMARQISLSLSEFRDLIRCPMSQIEYEEVLREKGFLE
jgi:hypothetical protein